MKRIRQQRDPRKQAQEQWGGAGNGFIRPLTLGFHAQMTARFFKGDFQLPALDKLGDNECGVRRRVSREQGERGVLAQWIADQHPTDRQRGFADMKPDRRR